MPVKRNNNRARGFTLVEVLMVVSIIAVLLGAFTMVTYAVRNRNKAQKTRATMAVLENAVETFYSERGYYPGQLVDCYESSDSNQDQVDFYDPEHPENDQPNKLLAAQCNMAVVWRQLNKSATLRDRLDRIPSGSFADFNFSLFNNLPGWPDDYNDPDDAPAYKIGLARDDGKVKYKYLMDDYGKAINYQQASGVGGSFVFISAGPDGLFDTDDDIRSGRN